MPVAVHRDRHERRALAAQRQPLMEQRWNASVINRHPGDQQLARPGFQDRGAAFGIAPVRFGKLGTAEAFGHRPQRPLRRSGRTKVRNVHPFDFHGHTPLGIPPGNRVGDAPFRYKSILFEQAMNITLIFPHHSAPFWCKWKGPGSQALGRCPARNPFLQQGNVPYLNRTHYHMVMPSRYWKRMNGPMLFGSGQSECSDA